VSSSNPNLRSLIEARRVQLRSGWGRLVGVCPLHVEPGRLVVDPRADTWTCSTCRSEAGTTIDWIMRVEGVSRAHAAEMLRSGYPTVETPAPKNRGKQVGAVPKHSTTKKLDPAFQDVGDDADLLHRVLAYYHDRLMQNLDASKYLEHRGIVGNNIVDHFHLGFADRSLGYRLPNRNRLAGKQIRDRLLHLGIYRTSGHEHLCGSFVVPIFDASGNVANIYGRKIGRSLRQGTPLHTWLHEDRRGLLNLAGFTASTTMIVTGSVIDALSCWCHGQRNVTAVHGFDGPIDDLLAAIQQHHVARVVLAFRRGPAGDQATEKLAMVVAALGIEVLRVLLPATQDVNDFARSQADPEQALAQVLRVPEWISGCARKTTSSTTFTPSRAAPSGPATTDPAQELACASTASEMATKSNDNGELIYVFGDCRWRVRGLSKLNGQGALKVNVMVARDGAFHVDVLDLYSARQRCVFLKMASTELGIEEAKIKTDLGHVLLRVEQAQEELRRKEDEPGQKPVEMTEQERNDALELLRDGHLLDHVLDDFEKLGVVGERSNLALGYLATVSRKLEHPLAVLIQSSAAAGKSRLMESILALVPEEDRLSFSALTGQSLFYLPSTSLSHRVLAVSEEAGADRAAYSLKLLQSEGSLTIASTGKDPGTGRLVSHEYRVEGPVAIFMTTTSIDVDEELLSRCLLLSVDESPEQTRAIHDRQRASQTLEGILGLEDTARLLRLHRNAQRLLRPLRVVNPHVADISFPDLRVRARRDHQRLLGLLGALTLLHQYQRQLRTVEHGGKTLDYIEVERADIELATKLMGEIRGDGLDDLPAQTRRLLALLDGFVAHAIGQSGSRKDFRFSRREVREQLGLGDTQLWTHMRRLVDAEYLVVHPSGRGRGVVYELAHEGNGSFTTTHTRAPGGVDSGGIRPIFGPNSGGIRGEQTGSKSAPNKGNPSSAAASVGNARLGNDDRDRRTVAVPAHPRGKA
jgi:DNA primase